MSSAMQLELRQWQVVKSVLELNADALLDAGAKTGLRAFVSEGSDECLIMRMKIM